MYIQSGHKRKRMTKLNYLNRDLGTFISWFIIVGYVFGSSVLSNVLGTL